MEPLAGAAETEEGVEVAFDGWMEFDRSDREPLNQGTAGRKGLNHDWRALAHSPRLAMDDSSQDSFQS